MTLVQTLLTPTGVIQVSDRQLTYPDGGVHHEPANKAVLWCGGMVIGFSGMAFTDSSMSVPISEWICRALRNKPFNDTEGIEALKAAGAELMRTTDYTKKSLTLMLAGVVPGKAIGYRIAMADNEIHTTGYGEVPIGQDSERYMYVTAGAQVPMENEETICKKLRLIHMRFGVNHAARYMVGIQRNLRRQQFQQKLRSRIGRAAMIVSLPPNPTTIFLTDSLSPDISSGLTPQFSFVADWGFSRQRFGPHFVCGPSVMLDFVAGADAQSPNMQYARVKII